MMEKNWTNEMEELVINKEFGQLSDEQKLLLADFCSTEAEFNQLKLVFSHVDGLKNSDEIPSEQTKRSLDKLFYQQYGGATPSSRANRTLIALYPKDKPFLMRPLVQVAAAVLVVAFAVPVYNRLNFSHEKPQIAQTMEPVSKTSKKQLPDSTKKVENDKKLNDYSAKSQQNNSSEPLIAFVPPVMESADAIEKNAWADEMTAPADEIIAAETSLGFVRSDFSFSAAKSTISPDGVYKESVAYSYSEPVSEQEDVLNLLSAAF